MKHIILLVSVIALSGCIAPIRKHQCEDALEEASTSNQICQLNLGTCQNDLQQMQKAFAACCPVQ